MTPEQRAEQSLRGFPLGATSIQSEELHALLVGIIASHIRQAVRDCERDADRLAAGIDAMLEGDADGVERARAALAQYDARRGRR